MRKTFLILIGFLLVFPQYFPNALGVGINDFKDNPTKIHQEYAIEIPPEKLLRMQKFEYIQYVIGLILCALGSAAILFLIIGGIRYITSRGNLERAGNAKKTVKYALIGLVAVILSCLIVPTIIDLIYKATA
jgi:hypothetical protein